ncbi:site-specific tyrosine recombinase/integron integrase [Autumnicola musiva]|uniref:Tyrosine-type recombinase/integrase n=1 Tax=Autumnicola musiva TaxID=3075589 RepID=A0ABU3D945_9FLAO|nr:site-specific tyrosine recombinase/integron integrase [Zunongwangia sp. F117]MDT0678039.1 tyrosine-type recombinase/integrase [Zunongwangia sp. F117]
MKIIKLFPLEHRSALQIGVSFIYDLEMKNHLMALPGIKWSSTKKVFYFPYSEDAITILRKHLRGTGWYVDFSAIDENEFNKRTLKHPNLKAEHQAILEKFDSYLRGKRYSESTVKTYYSFLLKFLKFHNAPLAQLNNRNIEMFMEQVIARKNYSISTHRQCVSAFKHFVELFGFTEICLEKISRPKKSRILPRVLSQKEVINLLIATRNLKHRMVLAIIYSSGLRIGELLKLRLHDIDIDRRQIFISQAKGRKDRYVGMAETFIPILLNYLKTYQPVQRLVEGKAGEPYSASSVRFFLKESCRRAGIVKRVTPHTLRHSYATHMLEHGVGLRHIQELLGHSKPETTMIYTHVTQQDLLQITSPLDTAVSQLLKSGKEEENLRLSRK